MTGFPLPRYSVRGFTAVHFTRISSPDPDPSRTWSPALVGPCFLCSTDSFCSRIPDLPYETPVPSYRDSSPWASKAGYSHVPLCNFVLIPTKIPLSAQTLVVHTVVSYTVALHIVVIHTVVPTFSHCSPVSLGLLGGGVESVGFLTTRHRRTSIGVGG